MNPHIRHLWPIREALSAPRYCSVNGRPVVCLTLAVNYAVGGLNVRGYHAFNLTLHLLSALALFGIVRRTLEGEKLRDRFDGAAVWLAAAIALIWEVHPLQTESVTYIGQRTELLMGLFLLLTLYCTLRGSHSARPGGWYLAAVISCALGMGSKEVMVGAPLLVLLYDRVFLASSFRELRQRRAGLYAGLAATWLILFVLVARTPHSATGFGIKGLTSWDYLKTEAGVINYYLRLCFWPHPLVIDYADWPITSSLKDGLVSGVVALGLLGGTVWALRHRPSVGFLGAWFFLILAPTSSFLPSVGEVAAERRMYLPLAAVVTVVVAGAYALGKRLFKAQEGVVLGCLASGSVVGLFAFLTIQRNQDYKSNLAIWQDTVVKRPQNARGHSNLGVALMERGRLPEAIEQYRQALRFQPDYPEAHNNFGNALERMDRLEEAIGHYQAAVRIKPDFAEAHGNLGIALEEAGKMPEAISHFEDALRIQPDYAEAHYALGLALAQTGRIQEAISHWEQALRIRPDLADAHNHLGLALAQTGRMPEAINHFEEALRIDPHLASAHSNLGLALMRAGRMPEATRHFEDALRINPDLVAAHINLGNALVHDGKVPEAIEQYGQALRIQPDNADAHNNLGLALERAGRLPEAISHWEQALRIKPDFTQAQNNLERARAVP